jgi:hypothetical protein
MGVPAERPAPDVEYDDSKYGTDAPTFLLVSTAGTEPKPNRIAAANGEIWS